MHLDHRSYILICILVVCPAPLICQTSGANVPDAIKQADAAFHAGYAAMQAGNLEQARAQFAQAAHLAPQIPEGHEALGEVLFELNKPAEAVPEFEAALQLRPGDQGIESNLALAYAKAGQPEKAVQQFSAAFQSSQQPGAQPVDADFCQAYARALAATGKPEDAIQMFKAAVDRGAATADIFDAIGSLFALSGKWSEAQPQFEHALSIDSSYVPARIHLGIVQRQQHDIDRSLASLQAAVTVDPANALAQLEYGRTLEAAGKDEAATPYL